MKPLTAVNEWPPIAVYDLEADDWVNIRLVCHVDEYGNRRKFASVIEYLEWLFTDFPGNWVFAHAGGHYDHRFLIADAATKKGWEFKTNLSGGNIVLVKLSDGKKVIHLSDSYRLMPNALADIGKTVGLPKLDVNPNDFQKLTPQEVEEYCFRDCDIVYQGLQLMKAKTTAVGADFASTLASIATRYIRRSISIDWDKFVKKDPVTGRMGPADNVKLWDEECMRAYHGGRTEMFRQGVIEQHSYWFDIISSYPTSMRELLPLYYLGYFNPPINLKNVEKFLSHCGITECEVWVPEREQDSLGKDPVNGKDVFLTVLPEKDETGRLTFRTGRMYGAWTNIELLEAIKHGAQITKITGQWRFTAEPWLRKFVDTFYGLRQKAKNEKDAFGTYAFKILLNSAYGKSVETIERRAYLTAKERELAQMDGARIEKTNTQGVWAAITHERGPFRHTALGAYITAYSRLRLFRKAREMLERGANILYCDTDSLIMDMPIPEEETGSKLGDWEFVGELRKLELVLPKVYRAEFTDGKVVYKCKGCPITRKWEPEETPEQRWQAFKHFRNDESDTEAEAILGKDGITGFISDVRAGTLYPRRLDAPCKVCKGRGHVRKVTCEPCKGTGRVLKPLVRSLRSSDKKRQWFADGTSKPLHKEKSPRPKKK